MSPNIATAAMSAGTASSVSRSCVLMPRAISAPPNRGAKKAPSRAEAEPQPVPVERMAAG